MLAVLKLTGKRFKAPASTKQDFRIRPKLLFAVFLYMAEVSTHLVLTFQSNAFHMRYTESTVIYIFEMDRQIGGSGGSVGRVRNFWSDSRVFNPQSLQVGSMSV